MIVRVMFFADYMAKTSFTLSLACKPLAFSLMRVKLHFHFSFTQSESASTNITNVTIS